MKLYWIFLSWILLWNSTLASTDIERSRKNFYQLFKEQINNVRYWIDDNRKMSNDNTFIGRCIGMARKLKFIMPLIIFKLGVIITVLGFLTIFSLKSLGLLVLLLLINWSGLLIKFAGGAMGNNEHYMQATPPQNVHLHVHQDKNLPEHGYWNDRNSLDYDSNNDMVDPYEKLKYLKLYGQL